MRSLSFKKLYSKFRGAIWAGKIKKKKIKNLERLVNEGLPLEVAKVARFLIDGISDVQTKKISDNVEKMRASLRKSSQLASVKILYSPKPGSAKVDHTEIKNFRPDHGEQKDFSMEQIANTGKNRRWGTALYMLINGYRCKNVLELGACAGLSAAYLASSKYVEELVTIEGSSQLAEIATRNLIGFKNASVINKLFDDALDECLLNKEKTLDFVYIDGHHEKIATLHYFERIRASLSPGALVVFDDIRWSQDMNECWLKLINHNDFEMTCDLCSIGIGQIKSSDSIKRKNWDLADLVGKSVIGQPHGWS